MKFKVYINNYGTKKASDVTEVEVNADKVELVDFILNFKKGEETEAAFAQGTWRYYTKVA